MKRLLRHEFWLVVLASFFLPSISNAAALDFNNIPSGTFLDGTTVDGVTLRVDGSRRLMSFDAECPGGCSGEDDDLFFPGQGKILIISEDNNPADPDDSRWGGSIYIDFGEEVLFEGFTVLDAEGTIIAKAYRNDMVVFTSELHTTNGELDTETFLFESNADMVEFILPESGGIDDIEFTRFPLLPAEEGLSLSSLNVTSTPEPLSTAGLILLGGLGSYKLYHRQKTH